MHVSRLWRYPVKSLGGEELADAQLTDDGVAGDRLVHVSTPYGPLTGRTRHSLLTIPARTGDDGEPRVAGVPWRSPAAAELIHRHAGPQAVLRRYDGPERFDVLNLLVATDSAVAELGADVRRLRPNILLGGGPGTATQSLSLQAYIDWNTLNLGRSAAVAYLLLIVVTLVATAYVSVIRRRVTTVA